MQASKSMQLKCKLYSPILLIHSSIHSFVHSFIHLLTHPSIHSFFYPSIPILIHSCIYFYSLIYFFLLTGSIMSCFISVTYFGFWLIWASCIHYCCKPLYIMTVTYKRKIPWNFETKMWLKYSILLQLKSKSCRKTVAAK